MTEPTAPNAHLLDTPTPHTIRTDRPCAKCGFNLFGQPIVREPHYDLVAARCPECGQLAALQEYPALGKWADRWAKLLAALWILFLTAAMFAHFGPTLGLAFAAVENVRNDVAVTIASRFQTYQDTQIQGPTQTTNYGVGAWNVIDQAWWQSERAPIIESLGAPASFINTEAISIWLPLAVITFAFGAFWSTALLAARKRTALLIALIPPSVAFTFVFFISGAPTYDPTVLTARDAAAQLIRPIILPITAAIILAALALGVFLGRRLARTLVRLALPPRMRSALSILWTRDNLPPPTAKP